MYRRNNIQKRSNDHDVELTDPMHCLRDWSMERQLMSKAFSVSMIKGSFCQELLESPRWINSHTESYPSVCSTHSRVVSIQKVFWFIREVDRTTYD